MTPTSESRAPGSRAVVPFSLLLAAASVALSFGAIFGLLADLQTSLGFSDAWLGVITAASFAAGFVAQMGLARYADQGYGQFMLRAGIALSALGCLSVAIANSLVWLLVGRIVLGFGEGIFLPAARRVVIVQNRNGVGGALGRLSAAQTAGFIFGPSYAAFVASSSELWVPFVLLAAAMVAAMPFVFRFTVPASEHAAHPTALRTLIRNPGVRVGMWIGIGMTVSIGVYDSLWARYLKDLGASTKFVGMSLTIFGLPLVLFAPKAGRLADRYGPARIGALALAGSSFFVFGYGFATNIWLIVWLALAHSVFESAVVPASQSQIARSVTDDLVAAGQGLLEGTGLLFAAVSSAVAAPLYGRFGARTVWIVLTLCIITCAAGAARSQHRITTRGIRRDGPAPPE